MIPGARLIILGRQGAGKGTQCVRLSRHFVVPHISTGDMLRAAVREETELGLMAKEVMDAGGLVGDDIMIGIVRERLNAPDASQRGYILDGFPRTRDQAFELDKITDEQNRSIDVVLDLNVPREIVLERISARRVCRDCGTNYTATGNDPSPWICDVCGGDVLQREDDTPESVNRRLDIYEEQTFPLVKHYSDQNRLVVINGVGHPDAVFARMVKAVEANRI
jgi:adenylate kinase